MLKNNPEFKKSILVDVSIRATTNKILQNSSIYRSMSASQIHRYKLESKPSPAKGFIGQKLQRKSNTEQHSMFSPQHRLSSEHENLLFQSMQNSKDFPSNFTSHKRNEYSGYKQINMSKGKSIKIQQETKEIYHYQIPRNYEINTKNIAKLRKRYSLEPIRIREVQKEHQNMFMATSKSLQKPLISKKQDSNTQRNYHRELRQILRLMNIHRNASSGKTIPIQAKTNDSLEKTPQNLSHCTNQAQEELCDTLSTSGEKIQDIPQKTIGFNKPYYVQIKKRIENKIQKGNNKKILPPIGKTMRNDEHQALCGWSTKSFYPKNRSQCFENGKDENLELIQAQI